MKKSCRLCTLCAVLLNFIPLQAALAIPVSLDFTATNFRLGSPSDVTIAPEATVTGSFLYEAASTIAGIDSLTSIDLTIDGYSYKLDDVYFTTTGSSTTFQCFATLPERACGIGPSGRDFVIEWYQNTLVPIQFAYSVVGTGDFWKSETFTDFSITSVPVPPALLLFGSGLLGLIGMASRKKA